MIEHLQLHPMMVHFPLALTIIGLVCLLGARFVKAGSLQGSLAAAGNWNVILGAITAWLTLGSGLAAAMHLHLVGGAQYSVSRHVIWAVCSSQLVGILAIWSAVSGRLSAPPTRLYLSLLVVTCAGLVVTGDYGGENVYHYALGVDPQQGVRGADILPRIQHVN